MTTWLGFLVALALPTFAGLVLLAGEASLRPVQRLVLGYALGSAALAFFLWGLVAAGLPLSRWSALPYGLAFAALAAVRRAPLFPSREAGEAVAPGAGGAASARARRLVGAALALGVGWKVAFAAAMALSVPTLFWDAYALWNLKAKQVFFDAGDPAGLGASLMGGSFAHYPLSVPLLRGFGAILGGAWSEPAANLHSVVVFAGLLALLFDTLVPALGALGAGAVTFVASAVPTLAYGAFSGYAELPVALQFLCALVLLSLAVRERRTGPFLLAGLAAAGAMFTKLEGVIVVLPSLVAALSASVPGWPRDERRLLARAAGAFAACVLVVVVALARSGAFARVYALSMAGQGPFHFHAEALPALYRELLVQRNFGLFWPAAALALVAGRRRLARPPPELVAGAVAVALLLYIFLFTESAQWLVHGTAFARALGIAVPAMALGLGRLLAPGKPP